MDSAQAQRKSSSTGQAWSSGRILTPEQRERKRQVNRKSSRTARRDFQSRLVELEERVVRLELERAQCPHCSRHLASAVTKTEDVVPSLSFPAFEHAGVHYNPEGASATWPGDINHQQDSTSSQGQTLFSASTESSERGSSFAPRTGRQPHIDLEQSPLMGAPAAITAATGGFQQHVGTSQADAHRGASAPPRERQPSGTQSAAQSAAVSSSQASPPEWVFDTTEQYAYVDQPTSIMAKDASAQAQDSQAMLLALQSVNENMPLLRDMEPNGRDITRLCNALVQYVRSLDPQQICINEAHNQDVIIRGIIHGWDNALARYPTHCPLWLVIRQVDAWLFRRCNLNERICTLRIIHQMYLVSQNASCASHRIQSVNPTDNTKYEILNKVTSADILPAWVSVDP